MIHEYDVGEIVEHNIEQTTNDSLNLGNTEMEKVYFYGSKKCIDVFDVHIKKKKESDAFAYGKSEETDAKYFIY